MQVESNHAPVLEAIDDQSAVAGLELEFGVTATDLDLDDTLVV